VDKARPILAIAVLIAMWLVYLAFFAPKGPGKQAVPERPAGAQKPKDGAPKPPPEGNGAKPPSNGGPEAPEFAHPDVPAQEVVIENDDLRVVLTNVGAAVQSLVPKKFHDPADARAKKPLELLGEFQTGFRSLSLSDPSGAVPFHWKRWEVLPAAAGEAVFRFTTRDGLRVVKRFGLGPEKHAVRLTLEVENLSESPLARSWELTGAAGIHQEATGGVFPAGSVGLVRAGTTYSIETDDLDLKEIAEKTWEADSRGFSWVAVQNKFFAAALVPADPASVSRFKLYAVLWPPAFQERCDGEKVSPGSPEAAKLKDWTTHTLGSSARLAERTWQPGEKTATEWVFFAGPLDGDALAEGRFAALRFPDLLDFGWFGFISRFLVWFLSLLHGIVGNWGVAIIVLVLFVRLAIFPISKKAQVSMFRMSKLQPQIKALQEKHKSDPMAQHKAAMELMRREGVSPFGGCLPIFLQIPIFLGLYNALLRDIHLRQAPFVSWIRDLSMPDVLCPLPFSIFGATQFHLLPIVMTITWFTQAYLQPRSPDPQMAAQQKIFMFMPLVIGVMMYATPSGLVLYWLVSTAWGIAEQQVIKRVYLK
jgi:YidC/Oxa1 family membrane protein insertase